MFIALKENFEYGRRIYRLGNLKVFVNSRLTTYTITHVICLDLISAIWKYLAFISKDNYYNQQSFLNKLVFLTCEIIPEMTLKKETEIITKTEKLKEK